MQTVTASHTVPMLGAPMRFGPAAARASAKLGCRALAHALVSAA